MTFLQHHVQLHVITVILYLNISVDLVMYMLRFNISNLSITDMNLFIPTTHSVQEHTSYEALTCKMYCI